MERTQEKFAQAMRLHFPPGQGPDKLSGQGLEAKRIRPQTEKLRQCDSALFATFSK
jgi:hypothetical protein